MHQDTHVVRYSLNDPNRIWIGSDGSGRLTERRGDPTYFGISDKAEWKDASYDESIDEVYEPGTLTYVALDDLPRDASALRAYLLHQADPTLPPSSEIFTQARNYLRETAAPTDLLQAFKSVLVSEPEIVAQHDGGKVILSVMQGLPPELRLVMVLNESGAMFREERTLLVTASPIDAIPPVSLGFTDYLAAQIVNQLPIP